MIGLDKIYLHHSIYPNKTTMIDCLGHHNSSGRNGSGKTTIQKLIPIFYGERVNKVVPTQGTKDSFTKYYLKSEASFIAFEYTNPLGKCCVILYKKNDHLNYRFITGALTDFFYTADTKEVLKKGKLIHEFFNELRDEKHCVSQIISTVDDYRAIIQNDKQLLRVRRNHMKSIIELANTYSLTGFNSNMQLMHKLTYALQTRSSMFSGLEDMIVSTQFDFLAPEKPKHADNKSLTDDLKSLHDFNGKDDVIKKCVASSNARICSEVERNKLARKLKHVMELQNEELEQLKKTQLSDKQKIDIIKSENYNELEDLRGKFSVVKSDRNALNNKIDSIQNANDVWHEQRNIQYKITEHKQLKLLTEQKDSSFEHYQHLISGINNERLLVDQKIKDLASLLSNQKLIIEKDCLSLKSKLDEKRQQLEQKKLEIITDKDLKIKEMYKQYTPQREELISKLSSLTEKTKQLFYLKEEQVQLELAEQSVIDNSVQEEARQHEFDLACLSLSDKKAVYNNLEQKYTQLLDELNLAKVSESKYHKARFPDDNSLMSFLKKNKSDWSNSIGKLIEPSILERKDLLPVIEDNVESFYGLSIELNKIKLPIYASDDELLKNTHNEQIEVVSKLQYLLDKSKLELDKFTGQLSELKSAKLLSEQSIKRARNAKQVAYDNVNKIRFKNKQSANDRQQLAKQELVVLNKELQQLKISHEKNIEKISGEISKLTMELVAIFSIDEVKIQDEIINLQARSAELVKQTKQKIKDLEIAFKQVCLNKGLDESLISAAKTVFDLAEMAYKNARSYIDEIIEYESWFKLDWLPLEKYEVELSELNNQITSQEALINNKIKLFNNDIKQRVMDLKELKDKISNLNDLTLEAKTILDDVGTILATGEQANYNDIGILIELLRKENQDLKQLTVDTLKEVNSCLAFIERRQNSRIYEQWHNIYDKSMERSKYLETDPEFLLNLPILFDDLITNYLPQIRQATMEAIIGVSSQIDNYYQELKTISKEINSVSNRLSNQINTDLQIDALSDISIKLVSKVEEIGAWQEMEAFHKELEQWSLSSSRDLPPPELADSLNNVISALEYAHATPDLKSMISLLVTLKENNNYIEVTSDKAMNEASSNGLSLLAVIVIYIGMSRYLCPDPLVSLTWPVDELSSIDLENIASLFSMLNKANIRLFSAFPTKEHNILKHFDSCDELDFNKGAMSMLNELPQVELLLDKLKAASVEAP